MEYICEEHQVTRANGDIVGTGLSKGKPLVRCKDCKHLIRNKGFMNDGYCGKMWEKHTVKFKPDKTFFCGYGDKG